MKTIVVNLRHSEYDIFIGRGSKWGNPFHIGKDGSRADVIRKHREWFTGQKHLMDAIEELRGKRLGCYCSPKPCHGSFYVELLEGKRNNELQ